MKKFFILAALVSTVVLAGCDRKETVVVPPADTSAPAATAVVPVPVLVPVPGPKGDTGATGATGSSGSTTVVVPPSAPAEAPK